MTHKEAVLVSAYTGFLLTNSFSDVQEFCEKLLSRPIFTHEFADHEVQKEIREKCKPMILDLISNEDHITTSSITKDQIEDLWDGCKCCTAGDGEFTVKCDKWGYEDFCPKCGRPLTDEA